MATRPPQELDDVVSTLHRGALARLELVSCSGRQRRARRPGVCDRFHVTVPLAGTFACLSGGRDALVSTSNALLLPAGCDYLISHPLGGDRSIGIFPRRDEAERLARLAGTTGGRIEPRLASPETRLAVRRLVWRALAAAEPIELDELVIAFFETLAGSPPLVRAGAATSRTVARALDYLHGAYREPIALADVAHAVAVNPTYLTQLFRRTLGVPLHRYLVGLRLTSALEALSSEPDLTTLALDHGFSSHSHFTASFRTCFGATPSAIRRLATSGPAPARRFATRPLCPERGGPAPTTH